MRKRNLIVVSIAIMAIFCILYDGPDVLIEVHLEMWHYRNGELVAYSHHPGVLTNQGADFAENMLGNSPVADPAKWIGVSNDATAPQASWDVIPNEITTGGMGRAVATYADDGVGQWNMTVTYNPTASGSCQLAGLYTALTGDTLFCADQFTQINYEAGTDTVQIRFSLTLSGS